MDVTETNATQTAVNNEVGEWCQRLFQYFLEKFLEEGEVKYLEEARDLVKPERNTLKVSFVDIDKFNQNLANFISEKFSRAYPCLCRSVRNFVRDHAEVSVEKEYYLSVVDVPTRHKVRELTTQKVGTLIRISGQVVRTYLVCPELVSPTYICMECQTVIKVEQQLKYMQPTICRNPTCNNRKNFLLDTTKSRFVQCQKVVIEEIKAEVPRGCSPRRMEVVLWAEAVNQAQIGDCCDFTGTLSVVPDVSVLSLPGARAKSSARHRGEDSVGVTGLNALGVRDRNYRLYFVGYSVTKTNPMFGGNEVMAQSITSLESNKVYDMRCDENLYQNLITSLFLTIHGNDEVKRGILLMLFGGVPKTTREGTSLPENINLCIVGDPSTAKSQFLKLVSNFTPRAIYTSGRASSVADLTAAVVHDEESHEFTEAGTLMLAGNGVCCIDEFDNMDQRVEVAIHEAMEHQTISIPMAGGKITLNVRCSILAAANPIGGRYDCAKSLCQNIALSAPIMSCFDLFFILVDKYNEVTDYATARHIVDLHCRSEASVDRPYSLEEVQRYILFARQISPKMNKEVTDYLVELYRTLRQRDSVRVAWSPLRVTVRHLKSMIRLSEAVARMYCSDQVRPKHVEEAFRLLNKSIFCVEQLDVHLNGEEGQEEEGEEEVPMETDEHSWAQ